MRSKLGVYLTASFVGIILLLLLVHSCAGPPPAPDPTETPVVKRETVQIPVTREVTRIVYAPTQTPGNTPTPQYIEVRIDQTVIVTRIVYQTVVSTPPPNGKG